MNHMALVSTGAKEVGLTLTPYQLNQFQTYYQDLVTWNKRSNLTAILGYEEVQIKHLLDSLTAVPILREKLPSRGSLLDVGSGGGCPGFPLKVAFPTLHLTLIDSVAKKTSFLAHLCKALDLPDVDVYTGRAEELAFRSGLRENFDIVVTRGVASMRMLMELTLPFCRPGGLVIVWKKGDIDAEIKVSLHAMQILNSKLKEVHPVDVKGLKDGRVLVVVEKCGPCPDRFPRKPGPMRSRPL